MTTSELLATKLQLNANATESSQRLTDWASDKRGVMGLLNDDAKNSETYKVLKAQYAYDHEMLGQFNFTHRKNKELLKAIKDNIMQRRITKANQIQGDIR